jgi:hypothetical protein
MRENRTSRSAGAPAAAIAMLTLVLSACELPPLTRERLFGAADAAAAPDADAAGPPDADAAGPPDAAIACLPERQDGLLSGVVVDACTKAALTAYVGVGGKHQCSFAEKGSFHFAGLPVDCRLSLTAGQRGYRPFLQEVVIPPGGISGIRIELEPEAGCSTPVPGPLTCEVVEPWTGDGRRR